MNLNLFDEIYLQNNADIAETIRAIQIRVYTQPGDPYQALYSRPGVQRLVGVSWLGVDPYLNRSDRFRDIGIVLQVDLVEEIQVHPVKPLRDHARDRKSVV